MDQNIKDLIQLAPEVGQALLEKRPVVALESTVIAHGLPQPKNLEAAARIEQTIRKRGATPATMEWLETNGVPVLGYRTDRFPGFYTPVTEPSLPIDMRVERTDDIARIFELRRRLGMKGSVLVCVPIPSHAALTQREVDQAIAVALQAA